MQQTLTATGHVPRRSVHVMTASATTGVTAAVGAVSRVSRATGVMDTSLMLQAVLEESQVLGKSKALNETRAEEELTTERVRVARTASTMNIPVCGNYLALPARYLLDLEIFTVLMAQMAKGQHKW